MYYVKIYYLTQLAIIYFRQPNQRSLPVIKFMNVYILAANNYSTRSKNSIFFFWMHAVCTTVSKCVSKRTHFH